MEWTTLVTALAGVAGGVLSGGGIVATWMKNRRDTRSDEVAVLQRHIENLETRYVAHETSSAAEKLACDERVGRMQDTLTAALVEQGTMRERMRWLEDLLRQAHGVPPLPEADDGPHPGR